MSIKGLFKNFQIFLIIWLIIFPLSANASFIEATIGTAVVNDATATYYNPAGLTLLKNQQLITLGSIAFFRSHFDGQTIQPRTGFTQSGSSSAGSHYYLPSLYFGLPSSNKVSLGMAVVSNFFNRNMEDNSILRYVQSKDTIQDIDFIPAIGIKINDCLSFGLGINISYAHFLLVPTSGIPSLNIPDNQTRNESSATALGGDFGILLKPNKSTLIGFNYRSAMTYQFSGKSVLQSNPELISNQYGFTFWTPARSVVSINHFVTSSLGFIGTAEYIQTSIFRNLHIQGIAARIGPRALIIDASVPHYSRNSWLFTLGTQYRINPKWIIRVAGSYIQSPVNNNYQIANGDSIALGASTGYEITKNIIIDGSYAHAFIQNAKIHIANARNIINGVNRGYRDSVSLKLTFNLS